MHRLMAWLTCLFLAAALAAALTAVPARADAPFESTTTALVEADGRRAWSVSMSAGRLGSSRESWLDLDHSFDAATNVTLGAGSSRDAGGRELAASLSLTHRLRRSDRDGWGWGLSLGVDAIRAPGEGWARDAVFVVVPASIELLGDRLALTGNLGAVKPADSRRRWLRGVAVEATLSRRVSTFAEVVRVGAERALDVGLRWWLRPDALALDAAVRRQREDGPAASGWRVGVAYSDW